MVDNLTTSDEILGKEVLDVRGRVLGIVQKMHIDRGLKKIVGITIDEGFMKPQLYVGVDKIRFFGLDAIMLNIEFESYIGLKVFNSDGEIVGIVKDVVNNRNDNLKEIIVKANKDEITIPVSKIKSISENVVLK